MKCFKSLLLCILLLCACRPLAAAAENRLVKCEYAIYGGMENESFLMTLEPGEDGDRLWVGQPNSVLRVLNIRKLYTTSRWALKDLEKLIARYQPETWDDLPYADIQALDAPTHSIRVYYADGTEYCVTDSLKLPEGSGPLFWQVRCFLESYTVSAQTGVLTFSSFDGGGPEYPLTLEGAEHVDWYRQDAYDHPQEPQPPGSGYTVSYVFRGRIPGEAIATVHVHSPLAANLEGAYDWDEVYTLRIDNDYNVTVIPQEGDLK